MFSRLHSYHIYTSISASMLFFLSVGKPDHRHPATCRKKKKQGTGDHKPHRLHPECAKLVFKTSCSTTFRMRHTVFLFSELMMEKKGVRHLAYFSSLL